MGSNWENYAESSGNYEERINVFDEIERQALMMADTMMQGMRKQFSQYL